jgi:hypothetical protein
MEAVTYIGVVKRVHERGFFFIFYNGREIFCHISKWGAFELPVTGQQVSFNVIPSRDIRHQYEATNCQPYTVQEGAAALATPTTEVN